ncbi:tripartite tricarboxylate transporter permease [Maritimibacter alkaliphilus]|uniref:tripartite tricarboxylate transporter permease n=1 Tax=Maritimibacter alkaliphilus TaxID=404236 RepID=UPI001C979007|nr:tripartite tricarboxylate transporter permease [Maritimibacter alkaliphilus]MBY6092305.1 tripartite tricarboxylate transporter permease [Maritimibacter alkaliphilus]
MTLFDGLSLGFQTALAWHNLLYALIGVLLGQAVGVLPGVGAMTAISLLLPITFYLDPTQSMIMLAGIYYGSQYGGSIASILLSLPGTPSSVVTCFEGHPMAKAGRAGQALMLAALASLFGSIVGVAILVLGAIPLAHLALKFGAAEYFSLIVMGMIGASVVANGAMHRAIAMLAFGILLGMIGTDINTGQYRYVVIPELADGISLVALAIGLFGVAEIMCTPGQSRGGPTTALGRGWRQFLPERAMLGRLLPPATRGAGLGSAFGTLPGTGAAIASFVAYALEKRLSSEPGSFGKGREEGLVAPESANNAAAITGFIPTLTLGIPGDAVMALMLGALIINGIVPGPAVMTDHPTLFWGVIASFVVGNVLLLLINIPLIRLWVRLLSIPYWLLFPSILAFVSVGVYSFRNSVIDVWTALAFGILGAILKRADYPLPPILLGFILGPMLEEYLRRAMLLNDGDITVFFTRPLSAVFMAGSLLLLVLPLFGVLRRRIRGARKPA